MEPWVEIINPLVEITVEIIHFLEQEMATHSSILVCEIPWTGEPDGLQSMGSQTVGPD